MTVKLLDFVREDQPLIKRWLCANHVRRYWGEPEENDHLLRDPHEGIRRMLIAVDGIKVGLVVWQHPTRQELDEAGLNDIPETVLDIDIMIGEANAIGHGVGPAAIRLVAETTLSDSSVPYLIAATMVDNMASLRAFAKAGFRNDREFDDVPSGRCVLMIRNRP